MLSRPRAQGHDGDGRNADCKERSDAVLHATPMMHVLRKNVSVPLAFVTGVSARRRLAQRSVAALLMIAISGSVVLGQRATDTISTLVFVGATVLNVVDGSRTPNAVVVVEKGRIRSVENASRPRISRGARVIDAKGKFIIPGLWDMHVEEALPVWDKAPVDSNANFFFPLLLSYGVTGVRDVAGPMDVLQRWRRDIERGTRLGPRIVYSGPKLGTKPVAAGAPFPLKSAGDIEGSITALAAGGAQGVYVMELDESLFGAVVRSARSAKLHIGGNLPPAIALRAAVDSGMNALDHLDGVLLASTRDYTTAALELQRAEARPLLWRVLWKLGLAKPIDDPREYVLERWSEESANSLFQSLAKHRVYQIATLRLYGTLLGSGDSLVRLPASPLELQPPPRPSNGWAVAPYPATHPSARTYAKMLWSVGAMHRANVPILAASDTPNLYAAPGSSLHDELGLMVRAGLSPLDAIRTATIRPAEFLGATDSLGTVAAGKVADFLVLDADPTIDIANTRRIAMVVTRGRALERRTLDAMRDSATALARDIERYWIAKSGKAQ